MSGLNQLGAIVAAISGYLCGEQSTKLHPTLDWQIICERKENACEREIWRRGAEKPGNTTVFDISKCVHHGSITVVLMFQAELWGNDNV